MNYTNAFFTSTLKVLSELVPLSVAMDLHIEDYLNYFIWGYGPQIHTFKSVGKMVLDIATDENYTFYLS